VANLEIPAPRQEGVDLQVSLWPQTRAETLSIVVIYNPLLSLLVQKKEIGIPRATIKAQIDQLYTDALSLGQLKVEPILIPYWLELEDDTSEALLIKDQLMGLFEAVRLQVCRLKLTASITAIPIQSIAIITILPRSNQTISTEVSNADGLLQLLITEGVLFTAESSADITGEAQ